MDSDDQNLNDNQHDDSNGSLLVDQHPCCDETMRKNQCIDENGNDDNSNKSQSNFNNNHDDFCNDNGNESEKKKTVAVNRLQALGMSDDEDFGEFLSFFFRNFCPTQRRHV